ncbi:hypothetical protein BDB00DRAFT_924327 [Zychaea mexicana]|uniref:uncharacterized protein n=1 Tax=Zychaea mexicana TaxID=64656 RepID=UPI0022FE9F69|nr:uncharacterized protein BDB00DRAFT_924327 [Zychaea mexicana]KAI9499665.1 hypothetical protein BDB00DRAFT_924327 [Zychaea mexicana]
MFLILLGALITYIAVVRYYRYQYVNNLKRDYPDPDVILKNGKIAQEIYCQTFRKEFPLISRESVEVALFKTFTSPTVSKILVSTRELEKHPLRRAEDTELILSEIIDVYPRIQNQLMENRKVSSMETAKQYERAEMSIHRLNELHSKYPILNDDYIFTIALFVNEPIRWINAFEWRQLDIREVNASAFFKVWYDIGHKMNIKDLPDTYERLMEFKKEYEERGVRYSPSNWKVAQPTLCLLYSRLPRFMKPVVRGALPCFLEKVDRQAFGLEEPSWMMTQLLHGILRLRANFIRYFLLPRRQYWTRTPWQPEQNGKYMPTFCIYGTVYPNGYRISELGPAKFGPKCPVMLH